MFSTSMLGDADDRGSPTWTALAGQVLKRAGVEFDLDSRLDVSRPPGGLPGAHRPRVMEQHSYTDDELSGEGFEA